MKTWKSVAFAPALAFALALGALPLVAADVPLTLLPAKLHIKSVKVTNAQCGKPLDFFIEVTNSGGPFKGPAWVYIKGASNQIGHSFQNVGAGATYSDHQASAALSADCCKDQCYEVFLAANEGGGGDVKEWDHKPFKICTHPACRVEVTIPRQ
jgi:hypothetical protein